MSTPGIATAARGARARDLRARIVALTPAPAVDRVYLVSEMHAGEVNRAREVHAFLAGKGVNVVRNIRHAGGEAVSVIPLAPSEGYLLDEEDAHRVVPSSHATRVNTVVLSSDGATTNLNESAAALTAAEWLALCDAAANEVRAHDAHWLVVAGSLPRLAEGGPLPARRLVAAAHEAGARVCLDSGGETLGAWLAAGCALDLVAPNAAELAAATGRSVESPADAEAAARDLLDRGAGAVLTSLGADGALLVTPTTVIRAAAPRVPVVNTTGAGDAALAGFLADLVGDPDEAELSAALRRAVAWGADAVSTVAPVPSDHPPRDDVPVVRTAVDSEKGHR